MRDGLSIMGDETMSFPGDDRDAHPQAFDARGAARVREGIQSYIHPVIGGEIIRSVRMTFEQ